MFKLSASNLTPAGVGSSYSDADQGALEILVVRHQRWIYSWLYRVVTNHVLNMKARGYEEAITGFDSYYSFVDQVPNQEPDDTPHASRSSSAPTLFILEET